MYEDVDAAVKAAATAQQEFQRRGLDDRRKAVACIRKICKEQAEQLLKALMDQEKKLQDKRKQKQEDPSSRDVEKDR